jgi:hypothetical protein
MPARPIADPAQVQDAMYHLLADVGRGRPVMQARGLIVFDERDGRLSLLPATRLSPFDVAVCGSRDAPPPGLARPTDPPPARDAGQPCGGPRWPASTSLR